MALPDAFNILHLLNIRNFEYFILLAATGQTRISAACMDFKGLTYLAYFYLYNKFQLGGIVM